MMIVKGSIKKYMGNFTNPEDAARLYDKYAICLWGKTAQVNFVYEQG